MLVEGLGRSTSTFARAAPRRAAGRRRAGGGRRAGTWTSRPPGIRSWSPRPGATASGAGVGVPMDLRLPRTGPGWSSAAPTRAARPWPWRPSGSWSSWPMPAATSPARRAAGCPLDRRGAGGDRRRAEPGPGPLDVLLVRGPGARDPGRRPGPADPGAPRRAGRGHRPAEGAALGAALLEALLDRGARVVATTHLEPLKVFAQAEPRLRNATVAFDAERLAPTFHLQYGRPGPSYALAIGERFGLPGPVIARARQHLGETARRLETLLADLDVRGAGGSRAAGRGRPARGGGPRRWPSARSRLAAAGEAREIRRRAADQRGPDRPGRRAAAGRPRAGPPEGRGGRPAPGGPAGLPAAARGRAPPGPPAGRAAREAATTRSRSLAARGAGRVLGLGLRGRVVAEDDGMVTVQAGQLHGAGAPERDGARPGRPRPARPGPPPSSLPGPGGRRRASSTSSGSGTDEARRPVEKFLDDAALAGHPPIRLVHGKGTGALRRAVEAVSPRPSPGGGLPPGAGPRAAARASRVATLVEGAERRGLRSRPGPRDRPGPRGEPMSVPAERPRRDPGPGGPRGPRRGGRPSQAGRGAMEGPLPLPSGEDAVLHGQPEAEHLPLLRLPRWRRRLRVPEAATTGWSSWRRSASWPSARASPCRGAGEPAAAARDGLLALTEWAAPPLRGLAVGRDGGGARPAATSTSAGSRETAARLPPGVRARGLGPPPGRRPGRRATGSRRCSAPGSSCPGRPARATTTASAAGSSSRSPTPRAGSSRSGAAALGGEEPKYLNSPETAALPKGQTLYALHQARDAMSRTRRALLVEGYVDCLMAHQHGFGEAVAVLGTALTPHHLGLLRRYADEVVLFFDADRAGAEAARRAEDLLEQSADPQWWALSRRPEARSRGAASGSAWRRSRPATTPTPSCRRRRRGPRGLPAGPPGRSSSSRSTACSRRGGHGEPAGPRHRQRPGRAHAIEGAGRRRGDRARARGGPAARRGPERPLAPGPAARPRRSARPTPAAPAGASPQDVTWFERDLCQLVLQAPAGARRRCCPSRHRRIAHPAVRAIMAALREDPALAPEALVQRLADDATRALLARWLVEEREWPDVAAEVAARPAPPRAPAGPAAGPRDLTDGRAVGGDRRRHGLQLAPCRDRTGNRPNPGRRRGQPRDPRIRPNLTTEDARP